jgi:O-antigen ligase
LSRALLATPDRQEPDRVHPVDLEPSLVTDRTYASRRRPPRLDVATVIGLMICLLYILPAQLIVPNLTYAGRPALLVAMLLWCWWLLVRLSPRLVMPGPQPMRWVAWSILVSTLLSYIAGIMRGLTTLESNAENFALLETMEFLGVILVVADGIPNWRRLYGVLRVWLYCSAFMAAIGLVQSIFKYNPTHYLVLPGLQLKAEIIGFASRGAGGNFRVSGTATHYIEFSSVLATAVPFAAHFARFSPTRNQRLMFAVIGLLCLAAVPVAISRTGILALIIVAAVMVPAWRWRVRYSMLLVGGGLFAMLSVVKPGVLGTLRALFTQAHNDPSVQGRTDDYAWVSAWFRERPWLGRGPRTLIPELYRILDNQWLNTLVTEGLLGIVVLAALHVTCIVLAIKAYRRSSREEDRHLCAALISAQLIAIAVGLTFDSMTFTTFSTMVALLSGVCGAVWRLTHPARTVRTSTVRFDAD